MQFTFKEIRKKTKKKNLYVHIDKASKQRWSKRITTAIGEWVGLCLHLL